MVIYIISNWVLPALQFFKNYLGGYHISWHPAVLVSIGKI